VDGAEATLTQATATEIHWSDYLADMSVVTPRDVWVTNMHFAESVPVGSLVSPAQAPALVGTLTVSATGLSAAKNLLPYNGVADWLDATAKEKGFAGAWLSSTQESFIGTKKVATFNSTLNLTSDALTKRCAEPGVC
jgi:hypothetical protein